MIMIIEITSWRYSYQFSFRVFCSPPLSQETLSDPDIDLEDMAVILRNLSENYDIRLRPGFGGK